MIDRDAVITRLGEGVDRTGRITRGARDRVLDAVRAFDDRVRSVGGTWVGAAATSACRRAASSSVEPLLNGVASITGVEPEILTGDREARYTERGVRRVFPDLSRGRIVDIGGGSTEWITFGPSGSNWRGSLETGVVTLHERCVEGEAWSEEATRCVRRELDTVFPPDDPGSGPLVGVGGTPTTLSALHHGLGTYDPSIVHGDRLTRSDLAALRDRLENLSYREIGELPAVQAGREDVLIPGLHILQRCLRSADVGAVTVSDFGILAGCLAGGDRP